MIILKSTKFHHFFRKWLHGFQSFIQTLFGFYSFQEEKVDMQREPCTSDSIMIFYEKHLQKQIGYFNSLRKISNFKKTIVRNGFQEVKL
jgi:hypothetical protein